MSYQVRFGLKHVCISIFVLVLSIVAITEYTHSPILPLLSRDTQNCVTRTKVRIALRKDPTQDPTRYGTISDINWGYTNDKGGRIVDITGAHQMGPFTLPTDGAYGMYPRPLSGKTTPIAFRLSTDLTQYGYRILAVRHRFCNLSGEICDAFPATMPKPQQNPHAALACNKTLEYEWVVERVTQAERAFCPVNIEALVYKTTFTGARELVTNTDMGTQPWAVEATNAGSRLAFTTNTIAQHIVKTTYAHEFSPSFFYKLGTPMDLSLEGPAASKWKTVGTFCNDDPIATVKSCLASSKRNTVRIKAVCGTRVSYGWILSPMKQK